MLKTIRNSFLEQISLNKFDPALFRGTEINDLTFLIELLGSKLSFTVICSPQSFSYFNCRRIQFTPIINLKVENVFSSWQHFDKIQQEFTKWLQYNVSLYLKNEMAPDLWAVSQQENEVFGIPTFDLSETPDYSSKDKDILRIAVAAFRSRLIESFHPEKDQLDQIDQRLNYLTKSIDRLNKIDWKSLLLSTVIGIATSLSLDTERGRLLFEIARQVFSNAMHLLK